MTADQYKNPPIDEAVCEFTFETNPETDFFTLPGKLHTLLKAEYSGKPREQPLHSIIANQAAPQPNLSLQTELFRIQLPTADGKKLISIGRETLAVNILRPYTGWDEDFSGRVEVALKAYYQVAMPAGVRRIGVRYINRIVVPQPAAMPKDYFTNADPEDKVISGSMTAFMKRLEYAIAGPAKIVLTHATLVPKDPKTTEFLLDIDAIWDSAPLTDQAEILKKAADLHDKEGIVFEALITDEARKLFNAS